MVKWELESSQKDANANSAFAKSLAFSSFSLPLLNSLPSPFLASALDADARPGQNSTSDRNVAVCQLCRMPMLSMPLLDVFGRLVESSFMLKVLAQTVHLEVPQKAFGAAEPSTSQAHHGQRRLGSLPADTRGGRGQEVRQVHTGVTTRP